MRHTLLVCYCLLFVEVIGQPVGYKYTDHINLISNGGFEDYINNTPPTQGAYYVPPVGWYWVLGSPDHFVLKDSFFNNSTVMNALYLPEEIVGVGYYGFGHATLYDNNNYQWGWYIEAMGAKLKNKLKPVKYEFSGIIAQAEFKITAIPRGLLDINSIGVGLSSDSMVLSTQQDVNLLFSAIDEKIEYSDAPDYGWYEFSIILDAEGGEEYIILGISDTVSFKPMQRDRDTAYECYYFYDNLSLRRIEPIAIDENTAQVFPNPSPDGAFTLEVYGNETASPVFALYDATGRLVQQEFLAAGYQRKAVHYPSLASGIYTWRVEDRNNGNAVMGRGKVVVGR